MHDDEVAITTEQVRALVADQHPRWRDLPVQALPHRGTDHALFRLGEDLAVRMPRISGARGAVDRERAVTERLAALVGVEAPVPVASGEPGHGFPWRWSVVRWVAGTTATQPTPALAGDLARVVRRLRAVDLQGPVNERRAHPLADLTRLVAADADAVRDEVPVGLVMRAWEESCAADPWDGVGVWLHGDLAPGNVVVRDGRLVGLIDWGGTGLGDPAGDLGPAWNFLDAPSREVFRRALGEDDATWLRGRGWALRQALLQLPYYRTRYVPLAEHARGTIRAVLQDAGLTA
ncbi:aminoglycoside phosphotransferase family protein [Cellulomonas dongxiuzhuiae]|uniref:Aminoglycoside phosphotransferase family protein n=1 Tax=Cellulomonas dongxiuzhuiae TaxID=2819979 RepID=A0ABX8GKA1_9CELL|nr:aminoglycoside phosphotransferase family protein [Cellulomonas dongxiuzhuiae]MBO3095382.1 aminoglycoside phosphotransferase family protein [Cellulomonas dongxiuzhuiae]QWC16368.1 aminoglycoside phosphotransferase family protein [Cellulomonas dongxiuzhuiae]